MSESRRRPGGADRRKRERILERDSFTARDHDFRADMYVWTSHSNCRPVSHQKSESGSSHDRRSQLKKETVQNSAIGWTDNTFNPWEGCTKQTDGCDFCYAESEDKRKRHSRELHWGKGAPRRLHPDSYWRLAKTWDDEARIPVLIRRAPSNPSSISALACSCQLTISFGSPVIQEQARDRARRSFYPPMPRYHNRGHDVEEVDYRPVIAYKITRAVRSSSC